MKQVIDIQEHKRLALQDILDTQKTSAERNRLGQFATPSGLAIDILYYALSLFSDSDKVCFLDPAIGTGAFYSALIKVFPKHRVGEALGFEIDPHYGEPALNLWSNSGLMMKISDFTKEKPFPRFNLVICNPPYVRHHHMQIEDKLRLQSHSFISSGIKISGLAGLYCHFLGISHAWMADNGIAGWLIPSEFMDVNYGRSIKRYLLDKVTLLHIHRFDPNDVQFSDALVSSAIVWFKKSPPPNNHSVKFTYGGSLLSPKISRNIHAGDLAQEPKWSRFPSFNIRTKKVAATLSDFFYIKRGLATGDNSFFILDAETIARRCLPMDLFRPILPSPRYFKNIEITSDKNGIPLLTRSLFLLDTKLPEDEIRYRFPALFKYIQEGKAEGICDRYICRHRSPWYAQEKRPPAPIICTYLGRGDSKNGRPFRFILNNSMATVANVYLAMYPTPSLLEHIKKEPSLIRSIWEELNKISPDKLISEGRVYGGGLHKLEPNELANVDATSILSLIPNYKLTKTADHTNSLFLNVRETCKNQTGIRVSGHVDL